MNSIHRNQPEDNRDDLQGQDAVKKIQEMVEQAENCFFCSAVPMGESNGDRPMNVRQVDDEGNLWFLSASDSRKDREKIKELWSPMIQTWFTEGQDNPRITVIKVTPTEGYYWDTKHGNAVAGVKILIGAVQRKTLDDSSKESSMFDPRVGDEYE